MRGQPVHFSLPQDLLERLLDYVIHVLPILALLVNSPGTTQMPGWRLGDFELCVLNSWVA
jgi:hypothetical protein